MLEDLLKDYSRDFKDMFPLLFQDSLNPDSEQLLENCYFFIVQDTFDNLFILFEDLLDQLENVFQHFEIYELNFVLFTNLSVSNEELVH